MTSLVPSIRRVARLGANEGSRRMARFRYQLPPLNYLVAFEAAAKHANFTEAARNLNVTRTAISHQVKAIEEFVGKPLFHRLNRSVRLTPAGEKLYTVVSRSLEEILDTVNEIENDVPDNSVTVTMTTGFSTYWLLPRITGFREQHPEIELKLVVTDRYVNLEEENVDVAIRYYRDDLIDPNARPLLRQLVAPTHSPLYKTTIDETSSAEDLLDERLIFLEGRKFDARSKWRSWFRQQGVHVSKMPRGLSVDNYANLIRACEQGEGFALLGPPLVTDQLMAGTLLQPMHHDLISIGSFRLKFGSGRNTSAVVSRFADWIGDLAAQTEGRSVARRNGTSPDDAPPREGRVDQA